MRKAIPVVIVLGVLVILGLYFVSNSNLIRDIRDSLSGKAPGKGKIVYVPKENLPAVHSIQGYGFDPNNPVIKVALNTWGGWAPIYAAGAKIQDVGGKKESLFYKDCGFRVEIVHEDNFALSWQAMATGKVHIHGGTLDMYALLAEDIIKKGDSRVIPRVFMQIDWSNGGDGVVVRGGINSVNDFKRKGNKKAKIVLAQNSPSHFFLMSLLDDVEIPFEDVEMIFTEDAIQAANAFAVDSSIDAVVTWAPFIFDLPDKVKGAKLLVSTVDANHRIADVLVTRADFTKDHADKLKCMANAIFKGIDIVEGSKKAVAQEMAKSFGLPEDEVESAMGDAHLTNYAENKAFFLNPQNPASFESIFLLATEAYRHYGSVSGTIDPEQIKEASIIKSLEVVWPDSKDTYSLRSTAGLQFNLEKNPILSKPVIFSFPPNRNDLDFNYDPDSKRKVEEIARLAGAFGNAIILLEGNVDQSRVKEFEAQGRKVYSQAAVQAKQVSKRRALSVKEILVKQYSISEDRIATKGNGWDKPKNAADPGATENRSVEVKIIGLEQG